MSTIRGLKRRAMTGVALLFTVFCCVSGGPYGLEGAIGEAGPGIALALILLLPLIWALPDALTSCELGAAIPVEGGYVIWVRRAMGEFAGFLNAWWTWIYTLVDATLYPVLFATYLTQVARQIWGDSWGVVRELAVPIGPSFTFEVDPVQWGIAAAVILIFAWLNHRGTRLVGLTSIGLALAILIPFALFVGIGAFRWLTEGGRSIPLTFPADAENFRASLATGLAIVMWNYLGWDALSTIAEEVEDPARNYPRALLIGLVLVTSAYLFPTVVGLAFVPDASLWVEGAWPMIAERIGGPPLMVLIILGGLVAPIALFTASLLASSRVPLVLAEARFLPAPFRTIHARYGTPSVAIWFSAGVFLILATKTFQELIQLNVLMYSCALVLETAALLVLRAKEPDLPRPFRIPGGWPVLALVFILPVGTAGTLVYLSILEEGWQSLTLTWIAIASGPIVYGLIRLFRRPLPNP